MELVMRFLKRGKILALMLAATLFAVTAGSVMGHEARDVGNYKFVVGFISEPAFEGLKNGLDFRITKTAGAMDMGPDLMEHGAVFGSPTLATGESFSFEVGHDLEDQTLTYHSHENHDLIGTITVSHSAEPADTVEVAIHDAMMMPADITVQPGTVIKWTNQASGPQTATSGMPAEAGHEHEAEAVEVPVEGLEETIQFEITHQATGVSKVMPIRALFRDPGHYTADVIPTAPGIYEFRLFGTIEGHEINEIFISRGGGGGFGDVEASADLQFPESLPEVREIESAVRGAQNAADGAVDRALEAGDSASSAKTIGIIGIILGAIGIATGAGSAVFAYRRR
tara:strand:- start:552 stop:1571 length:1020 start_codon:yes stop_codon:yes gene_type:complete